MEQKTTTIQTRGKQAEKLLINLHRYHNDAKFRQQKEETIMAATDGSVTYKEILDLNIAKFLKKSKPSPAFEPQNAPAPENEKGKKMKNFPWAKKLRSLFRDNDNTPLSSRAIYNTLFKEAAPKLKRKMKARMQNALWIYCDAGWMKKDKGEKGDMYSLNKGQLASNND
jgi:hypothetical protein